MNGHGPSGEKAPGEEGAGRVRTIAERDAETEDREQDSRRRDQTAHDRDDSAKARDEQSVWRDEVAEGRDREATELDAKDNLADRHTLRVEELRGRGRTSRFRAAGDRDEAAHDRAHAEGDRDRAAYEREQAGSDELTGARRRGVGLEELRNEIERARRESDGRLVAAYMDVDGLKSVNDEQGHAAGDALLRAVAAGFRRHLRPYDLLIRLGGDEFLCALPSGTGAGRTGTSETFLTS